VFVPSRTGKSKQANSFDNRKGEQAKRDAVIPMMKVKVESDAALDEMDFPAAFGVIAHAVRGKPAEDSGRDEHQYRGSIPPREANQEKLVLAHAKVEIVRAA
jgi:hypothetical protein